MNANPINYARGLLDCLERCAQAGDASGKAHDLEQLAAVVGHLREYDASSLGSEIGALKAETLADAEAVLSTPKRAASRKSAG